MSATHAVRMGMSGADGEALDELVPRMPHDVAERVMDQLWLRSVLVEQRRRTRLAEREAFDARADRLLELLDPQDPPHVTDEMIERGARAFDERGCVLASFEGRYKRHRAEKVLRAALEVPE